MKDVEAVALLKEMSANCIDKGKTYYEDDKRIKKAQAIDTILLSYKLMCDEVDRLNKGIREIRDKLEVDDYYVGINALEDLNKLLGEDDDE